MNTKAIGVLVAVALIGTGTYLLTNRTEESTTEPVTATRDETTRPAEDETTNVAADTPTTPPESTTTAEESNTTSEPDEATAASAPYNATVNYLTPARTSHEVDVTLSLDRDGVVTGATVTYDNKDGYSNSHQERFDAAFRDEVVGQPLNTIELSQVGGASLTSEAFNEAVAKIAAQYEA
ncbi:MAG: FMN-binding protein [Patescibacteria group bacterium]